MTDPIPHTRHTIEPEGVLNNNPGNIEANPCWVWQGQVGVDAHGKVVFRTPLDGLRAMMINIMHYRDWLHLESVHDIIHRWAPPPANPTANYVRYVADALQVDPLTPIPWDRDAVDLVMAMVHFENGYQPYAKALYRKALVAARRH